MPDFSSISGDFWSYHSGSYDEPLEDEKPTLQNLARYANDTKGREEEFQNLQNRWPHRKRPAHFSYINTDNQNYIASRAPSQRNQEWFWRQVLEDKVPVIVNLVTPDQEKKYKVRYLEAHREQPQYVGEDLEIHCLREECSVDHSLVQRRLEIRDKATGQKHNVLHLHYQAWPDGNIPTQEPADFLELIRILDHTLKYEGKGGPPLVHCLAGIGRTGTLIAIHSGLKDLEAQVRGDRLPEKIGVDLFKKVDAMRFNRPRMVQTAKQYLFAWRVLAHTQPYFLKQCRVNTAPDSAFCSFWSGSAP